MLLLLWDEVKVVVVVVVISVFIFWKYKGYLFLGEK